MANRNSNPRNPQHTLFKKLTKLLSGPISGFRQQNTRHPRRLQVDNYASRFKSSSGQTFKKTEYGQKGNYTANYMANQNRSDRYGDFDQMEYTPEIASAMDIYADEITTSNELVPLLNIKTYDEEIKLELENLFHNILNIEFNIFGWARSLCKYGDFFLYLDLEEEEGVKYAIGLPSTEVERLEGEDEENPNYIQFQWNQAGLTLENWQVAHFRILGNDKYTPYGTSVLEPARRVWRQLTLLEDAMMAYRIVRSPERRVFYVDVGNIPPQDVEQYVQRVMTQMKRNQVVDADNGRVDLRYNPMSIEEDYFIPVRGGESTKVETLSGGQFTGDIDDVKYLRDKLFSALKVPPSYLTNTEGADEDKTTLAQKDIRFARTIQRLQRALVSELEKIAVVHLFTRGYRGKDLTSFNIQLNNPSKLAQLQELEHWRTKFDVASAATEGFFSKRWIGENIFNVSQEEMVRIQREMFYDKKVGAELEKAAEEVTAAGQGLDTAGPGGGMGGFEDLGGGDEGLGGEEELGGEEMGPEPEATALPEPAGTEESALLAAPGNRDVKKEDGRTYTTTKKSHGWYEPRTHDGVPSRGGDRRNMGARKRHLKGLWADEVKGSAKRSMFPGIEINRLASGITENLESSYDEEEKKILQTTVEIKNLITLLESNQNEA
tara:strand:- start:857 stop:2842 length:1986 start_codon:yes stop_codon:yes gene_type:complete